MKIFKRILLGCLGLAVLSVVVLAVVVGIMLALGPPESAPEEEAQLQPLTSDRLPPPTVDPAPGEVPIPAATVRVELDLEEGEFEVRPGEPGEGVRIEANYDAGLFRLDQERFEGAGGLETVRIGFGSKYTILRRLLTLGDHGADDNRVTVYLPPDVALTLSARIAKGESRLDLSGLALTDLNLDLKMGEHHVRFERPNPLGMETLRLRASMGEFSAQGLGHARFQRARIDGSMGEMRVDLRGDYRDDAYVWVRQSMGELRVEVPSDVRVDVSRRVMVGELNTRGLDRDDDLPESVPTLTVESSVTLGELRVVRR